MSLYQSIFDEEIEVVHQLLSDGVDPNKPDESNRTPLMFAAEVENVELVKMLLSYGARVNDKGHDGFTPLQIAVDTAIDSVVQSGRERGAENTTLVELLLQYGASPVIVNSLGKSALDIAKDYGSTKVLEVLNRYVV